MSMRIREPCPHINYEISLVLLISNFLPIIILHVNLAKLYVRMRSLRPTQELKVWPLRVNQELKVWPLRVNRDVLVPTVKAYGGA